MAKPELKLAPGAGQEPLTQREIEARAEEWLCRLVLAEDPKALEAALPAWARRADLKVVRDGASLRPGTAGPADQPDLGEDRSC